MIAAMLVVVALAYARGVWAVWSKAGYGRGIRPGEAVRFAVGLAVLAVAVSPAVDRRADDLFAAHMTQHLLLATVAPPFLLFGAPLAAFAWALPRDWRRDAAAFVHRQTRLRRWWVVITAPTVGWLWHLFAIWMWHAPALYDLALRNPAMHVAEHASFMATAIVLWWPIAYPRTARRTAYAVGMGTLFLTAMQTGILGALITLSRHVLYPDQAARAARWGYTAMADQTMAGLIMWVPGGLIYLAAMCVLFLGWLEPGKAQRATPMAVTPRGPIEHRVRGDEDSHPRRAQASVTLVILLLLVSIASCTRGAHDAAAVAGGDVTRGKQAFDDLGCGACHSIAGVAKARGEVGPPLTGIAKRSIIAGQLANTPDNMVRWILDPPSVEPGTAMPNLGASEQSARDIAAYLSTLR